jgi:hypothetical protein
VGGAAVGIGVAVGLGDTVGLGVVGVGVGEVVSAGAASAGEVAVAVAVAVAVLVGVAVDVAVAVPEGEDVGSVTPGVPPEQAEIAAEASMATMPKLRAVRLARSPVPAAVACTFMKPPHPSGKWRSRSRKRGS